MVLNIYTSGLLKLCCSGSKRDIYLGLFEICQTDYRTHSKLIIFPIFGSQRWIYNIQAKKRFKKLKKNDSFLIWCVWSFFHFIHCNVPDKKTKTLGKACPLTGMKQKLSKHFIIKCIVFLAL